MEAKAVKADEAELKAAKAAYKVLFLNLLGMALFSAALFFLKQSALAGFIAGFSIGLINALWMLRIARKGIRMHPEKAGSFVTRSYFLRFAAVALVFSALIAKGVLSPWPLLAGFTGSIIMTVIAMILAAREENI